MDSDQIVTTYQAKLSQAAARFSDGLKSLRTGRASATMLDGVSVDAYGVAMPLIQLATISVPEAQLIQITPFDPSNLAAISAAIRNNQSLGLNPADDGHVVRVPVPPLSEERRRDLAKQVGQKQEDTMIALRSIRHDALDQIESGLRAKNLGEDQAKRLKSQIEETMTKTKNEVEAAARGKEQEILTL